MRTPACGISTTLPLGCDLPSSVVQKKNRNYPLTYPSKLQSLPSLFALNPLDLILCHLSRFMSLTTGRPRLPGYPHLPYSNPHRFCVSPILPPPPIPPELLKPVHCALWNSWSITNKISCIIDFTVLL